MFKPSKKMSQNALREEKLEEIVAACRADAQAAEAEPDAAKRYMLWGALACRTDDALRTAKDIVNDRAYTRGLKTGWAASAGVFGVWVAVEPFSATIYACCGSWISAGALAGLTTEAYRTRELERLCKLTEPLVQIQARAGATLSRLEKEDLAGIMQSPAAEEAISKCPCLRPLAEGFRAAQSAQAARDGVKTPLVKPPGGRLQL